MDDFVKESLNQLTKGQLVYLVEQFYRCKSRIGEVCVDVLKEHIDPAEAIRKIWRCLCDTPSIGWGDHLADYIDFKMGRITTEEFRRNIGIE